MIEILQKISSLSLFVFVVGSMLEMGLRLRLDEVIAPMRKLQPLMLALLVNFVISPLLAFSLVLVIPLEPAHAIGLLILGCAAGAPFLPLLAKTSGGNLAYSVSLMVFLMLATVLVLPLALPVMVSNLQVDPIRIAMPLILVILPPLAIGFLLARKNAIRAALLATLTHRVSRLAGWLFAVLFIGLNLETLWDAARSLAVVACAVFVLGMAGVAYLIGGRDESTRNVFALGSAHRNISAALIVAEANFDDPAISVMMIVATVIGLIVLLPLAKSMQLASNTS